MQEVVDGSGLSERTVRYYINQGLVPRALGRGSAAYYTPAHVLLLARIADLRAHQRSLAEIRELLLAEQSVASVDSPSEHWLRMRLHDDLELHVRTDAPEQIRALAEHLRQATDEWFYGRDDE
jgi:DNA-binding transcriptional MerR regulator